MSDFRFRVEETSDLKKNGKTNKKRTYYRRKGEKQTKKHVETLVRLLWCAAAAGLKPLRLPRAQASGNRGGLALAYMWRIHLETGPRRVAEAITGTREQGRELAFTYVRTFVILGKS